MARKNTTGGGGTGIEESFVEEGKAVVVTASAFDTEAVAGRDGSGPYTVIDNGVILPDGSAAPIGATFCAATEKVNTHVLEQWFALHLVVRSDRITKEYKAETIQKG